MEFSANVLHTGWPEPALDILASGRIAGLLHKIAGLALNLISIRGMSAIGLVVALWICPVDIFANLGLYLAAVNLAALAVFGRYELLVVNADDERKCADAVHLCILTGTVAVTVTFVIAVDLPPLKWSSLKYYFDRGGYGDGQEETYG